LVALAMIPLAGITSVALSEQVVIQPGGTAQRTVFSKPFDIRGNRNVRITASASLNNAGAVLDIGLVNEQNNAVESVEIPVSYFQGVEDGESWTEGSPSNDATLSSLPAGRYSVRVVASELENVTQPLSVGIKVEQGVNRGVNFCCALVVLAIVPLFGLIRKWSFEASRWKDSMFGSSASSSDDE